MLQWIKYDRKGEGWESSLHTVKTEFDTDIALKNWIQDFIILNKITGYRERYILQFKEI